MEKKKKDSLDVFALYEQCEVRKPQGGVSKTAALSFGRVGELFDRFRDAALKEQSKYPYMKFSPEKMAFAFNQATLDLFRSINFHNYKDPDETKYFSRICHFWLKFKPLCLDPSQDIPKVSSPSFMEQSTGIPHAKWMNEAFIAKMIGDFLFLVIKKKEIEAFEKGDISKKAFLGMQQQFASDWEANRLDLRYLFTEHSTTLHMIETYIDGIVKFHRNYL